MTKRRIGIGGIIVLMIAIGIWGACQRAAVRQDLLPPSLLRKSSEEQLNRLADLGFTGVLAELKQKVQAGDAPSINVLGEIAYQNCYLGRDDATVAAFGTAAGGLRVFGVRWRCGRCECGN
jgi:hypothetical protein